MSRIDSFATFPNVQARVQDQDAARLLPVPTTYNAYYGKSPESTEQHRLAAGLISIDEVKHIKEMHQEDLEAFTQDQLQLACRLALAEEQLLSAVDSLHQSTKMEKHGHPVRRREVLEGIAGIHSTVGAVYGDMTNSSTRLKQLTMRAGATEPAPEVSHEILHSALEPEHTGVTSASAPSKRSGLYDTLRQFHRDSEQERHERTQLRTEMQTFKGDVVSQLRFLAAELDGISTDIRIWEQTRASESKDRKSPKTSGATNEFPAVGSDQFDAVEEAIKQEVRKQADNYFSEHQSTVEQSIDQLEQMIHEQDKRLIETNNHMQRHVNLLVAERSRNIQREEFDTVVKGIMDTFVQIQQGPKRSPLAREVSPEMRAGQTAHVANASRSPSAEHRFKGPPVGPPRIAVERTPPFTPRSTLREPAQISDVTRDMIYHMRYGEVGGRVQADTGSRSRASSLSRSATYAPSYQPPLSPSQGVQSQPSSPRISYAPPRTSTIHSPAYGMPS